MARSCRLWGHSGRTSEALDHCTSSFAIAFVAAVVSMASQSALALDSATRLSQYGHTSWRVQEGALAGTPQTLVQTADGYLWIGTTAGVVRFDGDRFEPQDHVFPDGNPWVPALQAASDGSLWVGRPNEVVHLRGDSVERFPFQGLPNAFAEDRDRRIWFVRSRTAEHGSLCVIESRVRCIDEAQGNPARYADHLVVDREGELWIGGSNVLVRWQNGAVRPYFAAELSAYRDLSGTLGLDVAPDGTVAIALPKEHGVDIRRFDRSGWHTATFKNEPDTIVNAIYYDRSGRLWIGTMTRGVYRSDGEALEHFGSEDGLSGDRINTIYEDSEGNVWIVTEAGIDRLRDLPVISFSTREGLGAAQANVVLARDDGSVWVGDGQFLDRIDTSSGLKVEAQRVMAVLQVTSIADAGDGRLWVGADDSIWLRDRDGTYAEARQPDGTRVGTVQWLAADGHGNAWGAPIGESSRVFAVGGDRLAKVVIDGGSRISDVLPSGPDGAWIIRSISNIDRVQPGGVEHFQVAPADVRNQRVTQALADGEGAFWFATPTGLARLERGLVHRLDKDQGLPCDTIYAMAADPDQGLWLHASCGIVHVARAELDRWRADPGARVTAKLFDAYDGARPAGADFSPRSAVTADGKVWFPNGTIVQMVDPARLSEKKAPPPVHIEAVIADHTPLVRGVSVTVPARTRDIEIDYSAPSFSAPQRTTFRYKLEGYDQDWQPAASRRQAFYTGIGPGHYAFSVMASNGDEEWSPRPARIDVDIAYAFYETLAFRLLLAAIFIALAIVLYRRRIRTATALAESRLQGKMAERERIARELHDTLLQSIQGLILRVHGAKRKLSAEDPARKELEGALEQADAALVEGRDRVQDLRTGAGEAPDLVAAFRALCEELRSLFEIPCEVTREGAVRPLNPAAHEEVFWIAREALLNACRHSKGTCVKLHVDYDPRRLVVTIADDGIGADDSVRSEPGHSGIAGMRERARGIGGRFELRRHSQCGTLATLAVPARFAYGSAYRRP